MARHRKVLAGEPIGQKGRIFTKRTEGVKGDPRRPMSREELLGKFRNLAKRVIDEKQVKEIIDMVNELERVEDVRNITAFFKHQVK